MISPLAATSRTLLHSLAALFVFLVVMSPAHAAPRTYIHHTKHYEIVTDIPRSELRDIASHMDAVADEYRRLLASFGVRNSMRNRLYLFRHKKDYVSFMAGYDFRAQNTGGVFFVRGGESGLATWLEGRPRSRMWHILQHEGFHQFAHARIGGNFPIWANEGLAEYFGQGLLVRGKIRAGIATVGRLNLVKAAIKTNLAIPFESIIRISDQEWAERVQAGDARSGLMYAQAWSICHFLIHAEKGRYASAFEQYIRATANGKTSDQALEEAFGGNDLRAFEAAWKSYTLELEPDPISTASERLEFLGAGLAELHNRGVEIESVEQLKEQLRRVRFSLQIFEHGLIRKLTASDDELFEPPPSDRRRATRLEMKPSRFSTHPSRRDLPPTIDVTGLSVHVRLGWRRDENGELVSEVTFQ